MEMHPDYWNDWVGRNEAARIVGVAGPNLYILVQRHRIGTQLVAGRMLFFKPDCERVRAVVAAMRAEREAKKQAEPVK